MAFVEPYKPKAKIAEEENVVHIEIPFRPKGFMAWLMWSLFTTLLLAAWFAPVIILHQSIKAPPQDKPPFLFTAIFTMVWLFVTLVFSGLWWQMTFGQEIVTMTPRELILWRRPFGQQRRYRLSDAKNLRVLEDAFSVLADPMWYFWGAGHLFPGVLAFDYGASTVRFGLTIDPAEARQIVALLKKRFGQYMADGKVEVGS